MKIVTLNCIDNYVEVFPVSQEERKNYNDGHGFDAEAFLSDRNISLDNTLWMVVDNDPDEVLVFWDGETIPYASL